MADEIIYKCQDCDEEAYYVDLCGQNEAFPLCSTCLGEELIGLEIDKIRVIPIYGWDEWQKDHPDFRLVT